jgi:hypothetical protein
MKAGGSWESCAKERQHKLLASFYRLAMKPVHNSPARLQGSELVHKLCFESTETNFLDQKTLLLFRACWKDTAKQGWGSSVANVSRILRTYCFRHANLGIRTKLQRNPGTESLCSKK